MEVQMNIDDVGWWTMRDLRKWTSIEPQSEQQNKRNLTWKSMSSGVQRAKSRYGKQNSWESILVVINDLISDS